MIATRAISSGLQLNIKPPRDPGYAALRRAARAAIVIPLAFAFTDLLLREAQILIFVVFGCFSLLVISDFGGLRRPRALAYLTATLAGAVLVAVGTLVSSSLWLAPLVMLVVGFAISFSRIFGGYVAAANIGLILSFVIAVTIPASPDVIPARVGGWVIAGLLSAFAAVALWPRFERVMMHGDAAKALHVSPSALRQAELRCLRRWQSDATVGRGAMAVVMAGEWVQNLALLETDLELAVSTAAEAARKPWWR